MPAAHVKLNYCLIVACPCCQARDRTLSSRNILNSIWAASQASKVGTLKCFRLLETCSAIAELRDRQRTWEPVGYDAMRFPNQQDTHFLSVRMACNKLSTSRGYSCGLCCHAREEQLPRSQNMSLVPQAFYTQSWFELKLMQQEEQKKAIEILG